MKHSYKYYGAMCNINEITQLIHFQLQHHFTENATKTPICIWGKHGIGKTQIVEQIAKEKGYQFAYVAPAQFEEMGDLLGMPVVTEDKTATKFAPPEWVPTKEGPGILLIDDVNRADDRILRGIMQLLQNYELASWKLPKNWHIILTANPEGGDYSVTDMDDAMLTRMINVSMQFDVKRWAFWAENNNIDKRGLSFVLTYPEVVDGKLTTPRSLVTFFESIKHIKDLKKEFDLVNILALSTLDKNTATSFSSFVGNNLGKLIEPEDIVNAKDFKRSIAPKIKALVDQKTKRIDILSTISIRLTNYCIANKLNKEQINNVKHFFKQEIIPEDLRLSTVQDLVKANNTTSKAVFADPELSLLILSV